MRFVRPLYIPPLEADHADSGSLIMRDGTTAAIRPAEPSDATMMQQFVDRLSPESRRHRFFSESLPSSDSIAALCHSYCPLPPQISSSPLAAADGVVAAVAADGVLRAEADDAVGARGPVQRVVVARPR